MIIDNELFQNFNEQEWQAVQGVSSLMLISAGGALNYDFALAGQMLETRFLQNAPLLKEVLVKLQRSLSRSRVIRLPSGEHSLHEASFQRFSRQLIYIPLAHFSQMKFYVENQLVVLSPDNPYQLNGTQVHKIVNCDDANFVYLLQIETLDSMPAPNTPFLEQHHFRVLTPQQIQSFIAVIIETLNENFLVIKQNLNALAREWEHVFNHFGQTWAGELSYQNVLFDFSELLKSIENDLNEQGKQASTIIQTVLSPRYDKKPKRHFSRYFFAANQPLPELAQCPEFEKPIFIVSAPRAGSTLLFETLAQFPDVWTISEESHELIEDIASLHPRNQNFESNALTESHANIDIKNELKQRFVRQLRDRNQVNYLKLDRAIRPKSLRFLEKTPKNALRIPFLKTVFPDAKFVYLFREPKENISSLLEGWRSLRFVAYRNLPNWAHRQWSFVLPKGWRNLHSASLVEIAAYQWQACNQVIQVDLENIPSNDWCSVSYSDLVSHPKETLIKIAHFAELDRDCDIEALLSQTLPVSRLTLSPPEMNKWRKYEVELDAVIWGNKNAI